MKTKNTAGPRPFTNRLLPVLCVAVLAIFAAMQHVSAQTNAFTNATYTFTGTTGNTNSFPYNGTDVPNLTEGNLLKGSGITTSSSTGNFRANNWTTGSSLDTTDYIGFTLTADTGWALNMTNFTFGIGRSGTGPTAWSWYYSTNSFSSSAILTNYTTLASGLTNTAGVLSHADLNSSWTGNVLDLGNLTNLPSVEFRLYSWLAEAGTGTAGLQGPFSFSGAVFSNGAPPVNTDYFWAGNGVDLGGTGTWNNSNTNWSVTNSPVLGIAWDSTKKAVFAGTAGIVTVDTVSANAGMQFATTGYSLTNGTLTLGGASIGLNAITTDSAVTTTIGSTLAGTAGLAKVGAGTLVLTASNSLSGGIAINGGGLSVSSDGNLGAAGNDVALGGGTLVVTSGFTADSGRDFSGSGTIDIAASQVLQIDGNFSMSALTLNNTGTLDLNGGIRNVGALTFGAAATIDANGAIAVTSIDATGLTSGTALINNAIEFTSGDKTLAVGAGGTLEIAGNISGTTGRIIKTGTGTLEVNGGNTTSGFRLGVAGTTDGGTLVLGSAASMGTNTFQFNYGTLEASSPMTITNDLSVGGREGTAAVVGGASDIEFSGGVAWFAGSGVNHQVSVDNDSTFSGVISSATTTDTKLIFGGAGTMTMSGSTANTFTNGVVISNTLTVELAKDAGTTALSGDSVEILSGATLLVSASNQVADTTEVTLSGGTIKRASGVSETFGALNLTADSALDYVGGSQGTLQFGVYEGDATPDFVLTLNSFGQGNKLIFANDLSSYITSTAGTSFSNSYFEINGMAAAGFTSDWNGSLFTITAIPEPSTYVAAAGLLGLMLWPVRRRLLRDAKGILGLRAPMRDRLAQKSA